MTPAGSGPLGADAKFKVFPIILYSPLSFSTKSPAECDPLKVPSLPLRTLIDVVLPTPTDETVTKVTKKVNGGTIGLEDRIKHFKEYYQLLS